MSMSPLHVYGQEKRTDSEPVEMAAYIWMMKRKKFTVKDALTANLIFGLYRMSSSTAARSFPVAW